MKMKINKLGKPFVLRIDSDDTGLISNNGQVYKLDDVSVSFLKIIEETDNLEAAIQKISDFFSVDKKTIENDVEEFLTKLYDAKIVSKTYEQLL